MESSICNLTSPCGASGVVIKPEKGKALLWYNHFLKENGDPGDVDLLTMHGGCSVIRGSKLILTAWVSFREYSSSRGENNASNKKPAEDDSSHSTCENVEGKKCEL